MKKGERVTTVIEIKPHRWGWKVFVFAVCGRADGQRAIRAVSACNNPPVFGRAYSAAPTLFHADLYGILRKLEGEDPK
jgi:hypothetical protein